VSSRNRGSCIFLVLDFSSPLFNSQMFDDYRLSIGRSLVAYLRSFNLTMSRSQTSSCQVTRCTVRILMAMTFRPSVRPSTAPTLLNKPLMSLHSHFVTAGTILGSALILYSLHVILAFSSFRLAICSCDRIPHVSFQQPP
jgi:hypothetical protein